jgi:hypothetical protein
VDGVAVDRDAHRLLLLLIGGLKLKPKLACAADERDAAARPVEIGQRAARHPSVTAEKIAECGGIVSGQTVGYV